MPPRPRVSRKQIADAAVEIVRESGFEGINARAVAHKLGCSTQPVLYCYATMEELKRAAFSRADELHSEYLMDIPPGCDPMLAIGLNYIRFAVEEPRLFRFLFQSGYASEKNVSEMIDSEELVPVIAVMQKEAGLDRKLARDAFLTVALFVHGYASIIANNGLELDEQAAAAHLERAFAGAVMAALKEKAQEKQKENIIKIHHEETV